MIIIMQWILQLSNKYLFAFCSNIILLAALSIQFIGCEECDRSPFNQTKHQKAKINFQRI